ncbi:hypothetical protein [uncultured Shewanella sp.]|uniref:hypothetical protein n=1 Tax=uncultured Shewanella sp. TaxID=173975 RepID=UPI00262B9D6A|nr:hypothetical protein [uncultured Shewanella sp.]
MINIRKETMLPFDEWQRPTVSEVKSLLNELGWQHNGASDKENKFLGVGGRTVRRWFDKVKTFPDNQSIINYPAWAVMVYLATGNIIFKSIDGIEYHRLPTEHLVPPEQFTVPPKADILLFIGKTSLTGITRGELKKNLGWNHVTFSKIAEGDITYINYLLLFLLCKYPIETIFIGIDKSQAVSQVKSDPIPAVKFSKATALISEEGFIEQLRYWSERNISPFSKIKIEPLTASKNTKALKVLNYDNELYALDTKSFSSLSGAMGHLGKLFDKAGIEVKGFLL